MSYRALFDCKADEKGELNFKQGDIFVNVSESAEEDGWLVGRIKGTDRIGLIPHNYVEVVDDPTTVTLGSLQFPILSPSSIKTQGNEFPVHSGLSFAAKDALPPARPSIHSTSTLVDHEDDLEDDDGFQLVKPSQLCQQQRKMNGLESTNANASLTGLITPIDTTLKQTRLDPSLPRNTSPRLPLRPVLPTNRSPSLPHRTTSMESIVKRSPPPMAPKPKTINLISPSVKQQGKTRSASNPVSPPIQPKPSIDTRRVTLPGMVSAPISPPRKPAILDRYVPENSTLHKPSALRARARAMTSPVNAAAMFTPGPPIAQKPVLASVGIARTSSQPETSIPKKATSPPPPPPSRPKLSPILQNESRYNILFNKIHDDGYVDGETASIVWRRSKLSDVALARVWQQCDPKQQGMLNRQSFVDGMRKIDDLLMKNGQVQTSI